MGEKETDYQALKDLQGKIDLALLESTYATTPGHSKTGQEISDNLEKVISSHKGRVVVASFSSLIGNIYALFKIAQRTNRKIVLSGFSLRNAVKIAREQNFITVPDNLIVPERNVDKVNPNNLLFLCTGSQGEKYAALNRISLGEHNHFKVKKGDLIILSASEIPGNENAIGKMTDRLIEKGADIIKNSMADIYESGHGMLGDMKDMFDLIKPSEVMPIHGNLTKRYQNKQNYISWGMDPDRVHLTSDGQFWDFDSTNRRYKKATQIPSRPLMVDGLGITEGGDVVIKDRQQLAEYGFIVVMLNIGKPSNKLMGHVKFISRGFVYSNNARDLYNNLDKEIKAVHSQWLKVNSRSDKDFEKLKDMVTKKLDFIIKKKTLREPIVLVTIF
jgi:ribonuclease J